MNIKLSEQLKIKECVDHLAEVQQDTEKHINHLLRVWSIQRSTQKDWLKTQRALDFVERNGNLAMVGIVQTLRLSLKQPKSRMP